MRTIRFLGVVAAIHIVVLTLPAISGGQESDEIDRTVDLIPTKDLQVFLRWHREMRFSDWLDSTLVAPGSHARLLFQHKAELFEELENCTVKNCAAGWYGFEYSATSTRINGADIVQFAKDNANKLASWMQASRDLAVATTDDGIVQFAQGTASDSPSVYVFLIGKTRLVFASDLGVARTVAAKAESIDEDDTIRSYLEWELLGSAAELGGFRHYPPGEGEQRPFVSKPDPNVIGFAFSRRPEGGIRLAVQGDSPEAAKSELAAWEDNLAKVVFSEVRQDGNSLTCNVRLAEESESFELQLLLALRLGVWFVI